MSYYLLNTSSLETPKKKSVLEILQYTVLVSLLLYFGSTLFIPLSFSVLISFVLYPICKWLEKQGINKSIAIFIAMFGVTVLMSGVVYLLILQIIEFSNEWQKLSIKLTETANLCSIYLAKELGISTEKQVLFFKNMLNNAVFEGFNFIKNTALSFSENIFNLVLFPIFSSLILYHRQMLASVLYQLFPVHEKAKIHEILVATIQEFYNFIKGMLMVYLIVGILNSIGLAIVGIPNPILFGFMASILTFIPYVGIMIASLLPITVAWITFNSIWYPVGVILVFSIVQLLEGNLIFPFAVGNRLKINTLAIIVAIMLGGILWGVSGMILFIPIISIIKLIADRTPNLKALSLLLGTD